MQVDRRDFLKLVAAGAVAASVGPLPAWAQTPADKPNIILCMADDQGWGDMGYTGHPVLKTPNFDAMAKASLRFDRFYAAAPVCSPTRGSVMTGRHPNRFGCFRWGHSLRPQEVTIAEALRQAGYRTGHFGKWHLGSVRKGSPVNPGASGFDEWLSAENYYDNDPILSREGAAVQLKGESSMIAVDAALEFIGKQTAAGKPFFAVIWFGSPHLPHKPAADLVKPYGGGAKPNYYGEIAGMDVALGKLRDQLRQMKIHENTILWYCSDNGGVANVSRTGGRAGKGTIYEGGLRVPALLEWPRRIQPGTTNLPCTTSDIYPTLLEIVGAKVADQPVLDGVSLAKLIGGSLESRPAIGFWDFNVPGIGTPSDAWMKEVLKAQQAGKEPDDKSKLRLDAGEIKKQYPETLRPGHAAWLDWPWKLHRITTKSEPQFELYNLVDDPMEAKNLAGEQADRVKAMAAQLDAWQTSVIRSLNGKDYKTQ